MADSAGREDASLRGRHIVVTRPAGQAAHLAEALHARGAVPVLYPVLAIVDPVDRGGLHAVAARLDRYDLAIFVSPNAVERALKTILALRAWPTQLKIATMGRSSEQALASFGFREVIAPSTRFDSESLLALPELQAVKGWRIVIFRGDGGRELICETLTARGASVEYVECYRRAMPQKDPAPLLHLWAESRLDAVTMTSSEGLGNFLQMIGKLGQTWLSKTPLFVPHLRIGETAREAGLRNIVVTGPGDDGLIDGLVQYFGQHGTEPTH